MNPVTQIRVLLNRGDDVRMEIARKGSRELDARHSGRGDCAQQAAKRCRAFKSFETVIDARPVAVHVLTNELDFLVTERLKILYFGDDLAGRTAAFATPRVRHDAERTKLVAAFDDWNERDVWRVSFSG